jgi:hypothetical protein
VAPYIADDAPTFDGDDVDAVSVEALLSAEMTHSEDSGISFQVGIVCQSM